MSPRWQVMAMSDRRRICITLPCPALTVLDNLVYQARRDGRAASRSSVITALVENAIPEVPVYMED